MAAGLPPETFPIPHQVRDLAVQDYGVRDGIKGQHDRTHPKLNLATFRNLELVIGMTFPVRDAFYA